VEGRSLESTSRSERAPLLGHWGTALKKGEIARARELRTKKKGETTRVVSFTSLQREGRGKEVGGEEEVMRPERNELRHYHPDCLPTGGTHKGISLWDSNEREEKKSPIPHPIL